MALARVVAELAAAGWTFVDETAATFTVTFEAKACTPGSPVRAGVARRRVPGGGAAASVTLPATAGIVYIVEADSGFGDGTTTVVVTVTATVLAGLRVGAAVGGVGAGR